MQINSQLKDLSFLHFLVYLQHFHFSVLYPKHIYEKLLRAMSTNSLGLFVPLYMKYCFFFFFKISFFFPIKKNQQCPPKIENYMSTLIYELSSGFRKL